MEKLIENKVLFSSTIGGYILDVEDLVIRDRNGKEVMEVTLIGRRSPREFVILPCGFCDNQYSEWPLIMANEYRYHRLMYLTGVCENCGDIDL